MAAQLVRGLIAGLVVVEGADAAGGIGQLGKPRPGFGRGSGCRNDCMAPLPGILPQLEKRNCIDGGFDQVDRRRPGDVSDPEPAAVFPAPGAMPVKRLPSGRGRVPLISAPVIRFVSGSRQTKTALRFASA